MKRKIVSILCLFIILNSCKKNEEVILNVSPSDTFYDNTLGQTPINIDSKNTIKYRGTDPIFHYVPFDAILSNNKTHYVADPFIAIPTVHDEFNLKASVPSNNKDNYITINGINYYLLQFHFHWLSEHTIDGKDGLMEVHLVHASDAGKLAVVGILIQGGGNNQTLQDVFTASPLNFGDANNILASFNPTSLLPNNIQDYFTYGGSLTTPGGGLLVTPYLTGLRWFVFNTPIQLSTAQYSQYKALYPENNARPVQALGQRTVYHHLSN